MRLLPFKTPPPLAVAHRGDSAHLPENSLAAFQAALAAGARGLELDLRLSLDGEVVIYHDHTLDKAGLPGVRPETLPWPRLKALSASGGLAGAAPQPLASLDQLLDGFGGRCLLLLELKRSGDPAWDLKLAARVAQTLAHHAASGPKGAQLLEQTALLSFSLEMLLAGHRLLPQAALALNLDRLPPPDDPVWERAAPVGLFSLDVDQLAEGELERVRQSGRQTALWVCNSPDSLQKALAQGADLVMSDDPGWLAAQLQGAAGR